MILNKENYEFLMFELLEGNLNESEVKYLLEQINKDAFYRSEWTLIQQTIAIPDNELTMPNKQSLLKPEDNNRIFIFLSPALKIAATLFFFGIIGWWYYSSTNYPRITHNLLNKAAKPDLIILKIPTEIKIIGKQNDKDHLRVIVGNKNVSSKHNTYLLAIVEATVDTNISSPYLHDIIQIKPLINESIAFYVGSNEVLHSYPLQIESPTYKEPNKFLNLLTRAEIIKSIANEYWNDIPNLHLKITPKLGERNIGFELKGEIIYANALIEIK